MHPLYLLLQHTNDAALWIFCTLLICAERKQDFEQLIAKKIFTYTRLMGKSRQLFHECPVLVSRFGRL